MIYFWVYCLSLDLEISKIEKVFLEQEKKFDYVNAENRKIVRACSNAIKALHAKDLKEAKKSLSEAESSLVKFRKEAADFSSQLNHVLQEYTEAKIVFCAIESGKIPKFSDLDVPEISYVLGLLDSIGELKREMYESLRSGKRKDAEKYFSMMEDIFDSLLPLRFSNAILPEFRHKQDVGRIQIEQARGELLP